MKKTLAMMTCKSSAFILKCFNRGGSMPGSLALKFDRNVLKQLKITCPIIVVTGTNGKTSTANMISAMLEKASKKVLSNRKGDNLRAGITTTLLTNANIKGEIKADYIVLEVDELNVPYIMEDLPIDCVVITNFFRDQLDRAKEMEQLIERVEGSLVNFNGTLILNGNDPNVVRVGDKAKKADIKYYTIDKCKESVATTNEASEGKFCPRCNHRLVYDYYQYSHIGSFYCSNDECGFKMPQITIMGNVIDINKRLFKYQNHELKAPQGGLYTMYNCMACISVANLYHLDLKYAKKAFDTFQVPNGRNETMIINGHECILNLVKNPTGANEVMKVIELDKRDKNILIVLNDHDQDGTDVSWIYDTFFEKLMKDETKSIICSGTRCYDMALRLKYGGYHNELLIEEDLNKACSLLTNKDDIKYAIATYTALAPTRRILKKAE